jgi:hypothetical protein
MSLIFIIYESCNSSYLRTLFLPLYHRLSQNGFIVDVIRITPACTCQEKHPEVAVTSSKIRLHSLEISFRRPLSIINCVLRLNSILKYTLRKRKKSIVVLRSYIPAFFTLFSFICRRSRIKWVYDCDGIASLEALEYRASTILRRLLYKSLVYFEKFIVYFSVGLIARSSSTLKYYGVDKRTSISRHQLILDNCRDVNQLRNTPVASSNLSNVNRKTLGIKDRSLVFCHLGSIGKQYMIETEFEILQSLYNFGLDVHFLIINNLGQQGLVSSFLFPSKFPVTYVQSKPDEVLNYLRLSDIGFSLRIDSESMKHVKPLKNREYLFAGNPIVYTSNTGDKSRFPSEIGFLYDITENDLETLLDWVNNFQLHSEPIKNRCIEYANQNFSLEKDVKRLKTFFHSFT